MTKPENPQAAEPQRDEPTQLEAQANEPADVNEQEAQASADEPGLMQRVAELEAALATAQEEATQRKDAALRAAAEAENVRRRAAQDVQKARDFALEKFAAELLSVVDNLERAMQSMDSADDNSKSVFEGIEMTYKGFLATLEKFGIEALDPQGQPFNPDHHEAMGMQESEEHAPNTVMAVMQKGYLLNGRLLRPAMVMIARAPTGGVDTTA